MSHLTSRTKLVFVPIIYNAVGHQVDELGDSDVFEFAVEAAELEVAGLVSSTGEHHSAKIEARIIPLYE